jgi:hypothetical protein
MSSEYYLAYYASQICQANFEIAWSDGENSTEEGYDFLTPEIDVIN